MDTPDDDLTGLEDETAAPGDGEAWAYDGETAEPAAPPARRLLGALAGLATGAVGVALWGVLNATLTRPLVGMAVVTGLAVGYVVREVSRRADLLARLTSVVVTALVCVGGTVVGDAAYIAAKFEHTKFWPLLDDYVGDAWNALTDRTALQLLIYAVALGVAFFAAGPAKPKAAAEADGDEALPDGDEAAATDVAEPAEGE